MIGKLILVLIIGVVVSYIDMSPKLKQLAYLILGIAVLLIVLPLVGIRVPLN